MTLQELILSASSATGLPQTSARTTFTPSIQLHDLATTAHVQAFKTSSNEKNCLAYVPSRNGLGGTVWAVQEGKAIVGVWAWQKDQQHLKCHLPERLSCLSISPNGVWVAGGSPNGQVYLWEIASGLLLASWSAHYRAVTSVHYSSDSAYLVTASADGSVHIFLVSQLIDTESSSSPHSKPLGSLGDHTLTITAVALGKTAGVTGGRCWTASEDGTVKMWSFAAPFDLLATFVLPASAVPTTLAVDPAERFLYAGTRAGDVYIIPLYKRKAQMGRVEAVGGDGAGAPPVTVETPCVHVDAAITCLSLSLSATHLLVGTSAGDIHVHSLPSHQHIRTISAHRGAISHLSTLPSPADLIGKSVRADDWAVMDVRNLERMRTNRGAKDAQDAGVLLRPNNRTNLLNTVRAVPLQPPPHGSARSAPSGQQADVAALQDEIRRLKGALDKAVKINDRMWSGVVDLKMTQ
ncbi:WD40 repeat-like protein [Cutaneotrichosporon oleaginosum]|uniref:Pre-rRNA-processing protein IPI3 n=1 Tax=Cutaneotrichosporon oleaginosum TaxID=879819 RepID=A0A0J0XF73_9TREE|nr:WD40 repeat-like protein [Cutaneotrichosporon oleaginosum]KLT39735.1 WD40 repeat-like protein [Cutaneotrichosporon oleaginosum]TXT12255.1 hypothetical protein COLE_02665 [Cutaneotrichosporon oleaginosum]